LHQLAKPASDDILYGCSLIGKNMSGFCDCGRLAERRIGDCARAQRRGNTTDGWTTAEIPRKRQAISAIVAVGYYAKVRWTAMPESIDSLIGIGNDRDSDTIPSQPADDLTVERIAVLRFIHDDFLKSCRKSPSESPGPRGALKAPQNINPDIGCTQIASLPKGAPSLRGSLLVSSLVTLDMHAQSGVPNGRWIDLAIFRVEEVKSDPIAPECIYTSQTNVHTERLPAVDNGRTKKDTFNSTGREEKLAQEPIERSDKPRVAERAIQTQSVASGDEFLYRRVRKR